MHNNSNILGITSLVISLVWNIHYSLLLFKMTSTVVIPIL